MYIYVCICTCIMYICVCVHIYIYIYVLKDSRLNRGANRRVMAAFLDARIDARQRLRTGSVHEGLTLTTLRLRQRFRCTVVHSCSGRRAAP